MSAVNGISRTTEGITAIWVGARGLRIIKGTKILSSEHQGMLKVDGFVEDNQRGLILIVAGMHKINPETVTLCDSRDESRLDLRQHRRASSRHL